MGGKGRKRREKNYEAAHGGSTRLPPPPDHSSLDALPSKLRQIISLSKPNTGGNGAQKKVNNNSVTRTNEGKRKRTDEEDLKAESVGFGDDEFPHNGKNEKKKKKKRKRNQVEDLRFEKELSGAAVGAGRKERKKQRLEARKKKNKKGGTETDSTEFRGRENIKFGDVVEAPPKLIAVPKAFKTNQGASQERLRLQAVEAYRNRKGWASRPGVQLPPPVTS